MPLILAVTCGPAEREAVASVAPSAGQLIFTGGQVKPATGPSSDFMPACGRGSDSGPGLWRRCSPSSMARSSDLT